MKTVIDISKVSRGILLFALTAIIAFISVAFIELSFDIVEWSRQMRFLFIFLSIFSIALIVFFHDEFLE